MENARTDAVFSLQKKNEIQGTKNQRFLYLGALHLRMEKNPFKRVDKSIKQVGKFFLERQKSCIEKEDKKEIL